MKRGLFPILRLNDNAPTSDVVSLVTPNGFSTYTTDLAQPILISTVSGVAPSHREEGMKIQRSVQDVTRKEKGGSTAFNASLHSTVEVCSHKRLVGQFVYGSV